MLPEEIKSHGVFDKQDEKIHQGCVSIWGFKIKWLEEIVASMNTTTHDGLIFEVPWGEVLWLLRKWEIPSLAASLYLLIKLIVLTSPFPEIFIWKDACFN